MPKIFLKSKLSHKIALCFWSVAGSALAQTAPDAGMLRQQIEQGRDLDLPRKVLPEKPAEPKAMPPLSGALVTATSFKFVGNSLITSEELAPVLDGFLNRPLDYAQLQAATVEVANAYRKAGWIVRTWLPHQDVTEGVILIQIQEAQFGSARLEGDAPARVNPEVWQNIIEHAQASGAPLSAPALDRALLLLDDLPGVMASGSLTPGAQYGQTDLLINLRDEPLLNGNVVIDNTGDRSTGSNRLMANLYDNSPFRLGDQITVNYLHTSGDDYGRLAYTLPVGSSGLRVGTNLSTLDYQLITKEFSSLDAGGDSMSYGVEANYPLVRGRMDNLYLCANLDTKRFDNNASGATTSKYDANVGNLGLIANHYDTWAGGGSNQGSLYLSSGQISPSNDLAARTDYSDGSYSKLRYGLNRQQVITPELSAYLAYSGQFSADNLDSSEKFYVGGSNGVRAYPSNEGGGTSGHLLNLELRRRLAERWQISSFYDYGQVTQYAHNQDTNGNSLTGDVSNHLTYRGYGIAVNWQGPLGSDLNLTWARRQGHNPHPTANGNDQDGSLDQDRIWLSLSLPLDSIVKTASTLSAGAQVPVVPKTEPSPPAPPEIAPPAEPEVAPIATPLSTAPVTTTVATIAPVIVPPIEPTPVPNVQPVAAIDSRKAVEATLEAWRIAWEARDVSAYLSHYAASFQPADQLSREQWQTQRRRRLQAAERINLEFTDQHFQVECDQAEVHFTQHYRANNHTDVVRKTLHLTRIGNTWQIVSEQQQAQR